MIKHKNKIDLINQAKYKFEELLTNSTKELDFNLNYIKQLYDNHTDFINFIKIMNIYEVYRWTNLKFDYNFIKIKTTKDKKIIYGITKFLNSLTNYYNQIEINNINFRIKDISYKIELMICTFIKLQIYHNNITNKMRNVIKNNTIIKINNINDANKNLIQKLYENYISIKLINIQYKKLRNLRKQLLFTIKN
jgi:hypothetical protein